MGKIQAKFFAEFISLLLIVYITATAYVVSSVWHTPLTHHRYVVGLVFSFEHILLVVAVWLQWAIKPRPKWVRLAIARRDYLTREKLLRQASLTRQVSLSQQPSLSRQSSVSPPWTNRICTVTHLVEKFWNQLVFVVVKLPLVYRVQSCQIC